MADTDDQEPKDVADKRTKAVDMLYEAMIFWHKEGIEIIEEIKRRLQDSGNGKDALALAKIWKGYDDKWIDIASKLAPYQSAKLSSVELKGGTVTKYIVEVPRRARDPKEWLEQAAIDMKQIPHLNQKPIVNIVQDPEDTIDEIEYEDINNHNGYEVH